MFGLRSAKGRVHRSRFTRAEGRTEGSSPWPICLSLESRSAWLRYGEDPDIQLDPSREASGFHVSSGNVRMLYREAGAGHDAEPMA
jgi:hypothetical protein